MAQEKIDSRVRDLIENYVISNHRLLFVVLGEKGFLNVPTLYNFVAKKKLSILWCSDNPKDIRKIGWHTGDHDVTHCLYSEMEKIQHKNFNVVVMRDMEENIHPLHLANIVNSVYGCGILIFLFSKVNVVERFTSPKISDFTKSKFWKRLCATFESSPCCVILDNKLNVLAFPKNASKQHLKDKKMSNSDCQEENLSNNFGDEDKVDEKYFHLTEQHLTADQTKFLSQCLVTLKQRCNYTTVSASSPAGRGKSVVLGLAIAGAIDMKYSNILISSLSFENVKMVFKFILEGLHALNYEEDVHYDIIEYVHPILNTTVLGLNIFKDHAQVVRFIYPNENDSLLKEAELVVIDDAAAMPLSLMKTLIGPYVILMASTTAGCGASGKVLYEDMINEISLTSSCTNKISAISLFPTSERNTLVQIELNEPVHYAAEDGVEKWINRSLCLESSLASLSCGLPALEHCRLFYVCRESLFSYESHSERFLQQLMSIFSCSKRKISPDDLLTIADGNDYHIFCLLPPFDGDKKTSYDILCAILVREVKHIPQNIVNSGIHQPEPVPECFNDWKSIFGEQDFLPMHGIHIVDIVTHPTCRQKDFNYDYHALQLLQEFYSGKSVPLDDNPFIYSTESKSTIDGTRQDLPLLLQLTEVELEKMEYIVVSYSLTAQHLKFWKKCGFVPMYVTSNKNPAQEHLCIMMKGFDTEEILAYMKDNWSDFRNHYLECRLRADFNYFPTLLALDLLISVFSRHMPKEALTKKVISRYLTPEGMKKLEDYSRNSCELHTITQYIKTLSNFYFENRCVGVDITRVQQAIFLSFGLQCKTVNEIASDIGLKSSQVHAQLNQVIIKLTKYLNSIIEKEVEKTIPVRDINMIPVAQSIEEELDEAAEKVKEKHAENLKRLEELDFSEFAIKGSEDDWEKALHTGRKTLVSIKSLRKAPENVEFPKRRTAESVEFSKKKKFKRKK